MTNAIQRQSPAALEQQQRDSMEIRIALNANLWGMPDDRVWAYYRWMSERLALDPMSHPFDIITDAKQNKKALYANSSCTSQLGDRAKLSYGKLEIDVNDGLLALGFKVAHISLAVTSPDGRTLVAEAFIDLMSAWVEKGAPPAPLAGNNLINALKKGGTQCRRRGTLQMLGLSAPGEAIPTVRLGDIERTDEEAEGVLVEQPPASALLPAAATPQRGSKLLGLQQALGWTDDQLRQVIGEETKIGKNLTLTQALAAMTDEQGRRMVRVLDAELRLRAGLFESEEARK